ncbi:MAG: adenylosuccinate synthase [Anaerolineales bacterium]
MPLDILVGAQWGDEGKGRITDLLAEDADIVARYSGGDNAGHTVTVGAQLFKLHLLPSGIVQPRTVSVLGNGMVINPARLLAEMEELAKHGMDVSPTRIKISAAAHLITPAHIALDRAEEAARAGGKIGTTGRGIGPAYTAKTSRHGLRAELLLDPKKLGDAIHEHIRQTNTYLQKIYQMPLLDAGVVATEYAAHAQRLAPYIIDTSLYLHQQLQAGARVIAEGAQGTLLDVDHGTYPYVTSSSPAAGGVFSGLGIGPKWVGRILGVTKAFQTRVGEGPFPTEAFGAQAERLRGTGSNPWDEFGTTTGRPRRCGWLDLVLLRYAIRVNGLTELALTKMDVLSGLRTVKLCTAYTISGQTHTELPLGPADLSPFTAVYEELPGWDEDVTSVRTLEALPPNARHYLRRIEALTGVPVTLVSVGPEREQIVFVK